MILSPTRILSGFLAKMLCVFLIFRVSNRR
jgi:hypothetical protein